MSLQLNNTESHFLFRILSEAGIELIFGSDANGNAGSIIVPSIQLKHEQAAVHAADGYARATGKPGVVVLATASGITNGITGVATAYNDSIPLVVIAGPFFNKQSNFQELDISGMMVPITKRIFLVKNEQELGAIMQTALTASVNGRPGPVLIEFSPDSNGQQYQLGPRHKESKPEITQKSLELAKKYLETAKRPIFFIGGGAIISGASKLLTEIALQTRIPVVTSLMGIGSFPGNDPLYLGMLGMHGTFAANKAVHHADLLICIGVRFSDRATGKVSSFSPQSKKIHVDIDPAEINKIIQVDLPIVSDAKEFLHGLKKVINVEHIRGNTEIWVNEMTKLKRTVPHFEKSNSILSPQTVIRLLDEFSEQDALVVTDVGQHQMWTAHHYRFTKPRTLITSGGLGTMGYGLPAAIGAAGANATNQVICVTGDGSFQMNLQEIITAVHYQLPIKIAIMNNGYLGMVRQWQEMFYHGRYSAVKMTSPNFAALGEAYGALGLKARSEDEAMQIIKTAFEHSGPVIMEFDVIEEENVFPIVPPNHSNDQLILNGSKN